MPANLKSLALRAASSIVPKSFHSSLRLWLMFDTPDRAPRPIDQFNTDPVLVLAPHADDEVIGPGGTVRLHVQAGAPVSVVVITDGRVGGYDDGTLIARRQDESRACAKVLGTREPVFLNAPDTQLDDTPEVVQAIVRIIRETNPSVIYLPALTDHHRDHWATNRVLNTALPQLDEPLRSRLIIRGYEIWSPTLANRFCDISAVVELKRQAIECFPSQTAADDYTAAALGLNRYRSLRGLHGRGYAEAFMELSSEEFTKLYNAAKLRH